MKNKADYIAICVGLAIIPGCDYSSRHKDVLTYTATINAFK